MQNCQNNDKCHKLSGYNLPLVSSNRYMEKFSYYSGHLVYSFLVSLGVIIIYLSFKNVKFSLLKAAAYPTCLLQMMADFAIFFPESSSRWCFPRDHVTPWGIHPGPGHCIFGIWDA